MASDKVHRLEETYSIRINNQDWARLLLYWRAQGRIFPDRASLIRETYQTFLKEHNVRELTSLEADEIKSEEMYVRQPKQKIMREIVERATSSRVAQVRELLQTHESDEIDIQAALENLPMEEE